MCTPPPEYFLHVISPFLRQDVLQGVAKVGDANDDWPTWLLLLGTSIWPRTFSRGDKNDGSLIILDQSEQDSSADATASR